MLKEERRPVGVKGTKMTVREAIAARQKNRVVERDIPGLGKVMVRRISAAEMFALPEEHERSALVALAAMDEESKPLYANHQEAGAEDAGVFFALSKACNEVNVISLEDAEKK